MLQPYNTPCSGGQVSKHSLFVRIGHVGVALSLKSRVFLPGTDNFFAIDASRIMRLYLDTHI